VTELSSAEVLLAALRLVEVALSNDDRDEAATAVRAAARSFDVETAQRVAAAAACVAAFEMCRRAKGGRSRGAVVRPADARAAALRRLERMRLEALWNAS
jgi:hypothetical protein